MIVVASLRHTRDNSPDNACKRLLGMPDKTDNHHLKRSRLLDYFLVILYEMARQPYTFLVLWHYRSLNSSMSSEEEYYV
jgi:hypothetical protein